LFLKGGKMSIDKERFTVDLTFDELMKLRAKMEIDGGILCKNISKKIYQQMLKQTKYRICGR